MEAILILNNIRSSHNVGSIFRIADCAGINKIFLCGYTPAPIDKFERINKEIAKTALGAEKTINWSSYKNINVLINKLKKEDYFIIAIEQSDKSKNYRNIKPRIKTAFIVGNEVSGVDKKVLSSVDVIAEIPMKGGKESLNVTSATAIAIFQILNI